MFCCYFNMEKYYEDQEQLRREEAEKPAGKYKIDFNELERQVNELPEEE